LTYWEILEFLTYDLINLLLLSLFGDGMKQHVALIEEIRELVLQLKESKG